MEPLAAEEIRGSFVNSSKSLVKAITMMAVNAVRGGKTPKAAGAR